MQRVSKSAIFVIQISLSVQSDLLFFVHLLYRPGRSPDEEDAYNLTVTNTDRHNSSVSKMWPKLEILSTW